MCIVRVRNSRHLIEKDFCMPSLGKPRPGRRARRILPRAPPGVDRGEICHCAETNQNAELPLCDQIALRIKLGSCRLIVYNCKGQHPLRYAMEPYFDHHTCHTPPYTHGSRLAVTPPCRCPGMPSRLPLRPSAASSAHATPPIGIYSYGCELRGAISFTSWQGGRPLRTAWQPVDVTSTRRSVTALYCLLAPYNLVACCICTRMDTLLPSWRS